MIQGLKHIWNRLTGQRATVSSPPAAPEAAAEALAVLFSRLRDEKVLRPYVGIEECKAVCAAMERGMGLDDRAALETLLTRLVVKKNADAPALSGALDRFFAEQAAALQKKIAATLAETARQAESKDAQNAAQASSQTKQTDKAQQTNEPASAATGPQLELYLSAAKNIVPETGERMPEHPSPLKDRFVFTDDYQPVTVRQMEQMWRFLRKPSRTGLLTNEIDLPRTVTRMAKQGWLETPEWQAEKINKVRLVLLLDHQGSMSAWHALGRQLATTARGGGGHRDAEIFWFYNLPQQLIAPAQDARLQAAQAGIFFKDVAHQKPERVEALLRRCSRQDTEVLIWSDAGAARGRMNPDRAYATAALLRLLRKNVSSVAWLNPMPAHRWWGSTAELLADQVAMFEADPRGLMAAVNHLRGRG